MMETIFNLRWLDFKGIFFSLLIWKKPTVFHLSLSTFPAYQAINVENGDMKYDM